MVWLTRNYGQFPNAWPVVPRWGSGKIGKGYLVGDEGDRLGTRLLIRVVGLVGRVVRTCRHHQRLRRSAIGFSAPSSPGS